MRKAGGIALGAFVALLVAWGVLHVFIQPVNPEQEVPEKHAEAACGWCHFVSEKAPIVEP